MMDIAPARPMSPAMVKKGYEKLEKQMDESKNQYYFTVRAKEDDRLIGKAIIQWIEWANSNGFIRLGIGAAEDRGKGYGTQALSMVLRFAFAELNLFRITALVPEYNTAAIALLKKFGFVEEVRRRQSVERDNRRWDMLVFGLLKEDWQSSANMSS
jgi:RimJ/RimL family protein N-acetyltransferase